MDSQHREWWGEEWQGWNAASKWSRLPVVPIPILFDALSSIAGIEWPKTPYSTQRLASSPSRSRPPSAFLPSFLGPLPRCGSASASTSTPCDHLLVWIRKALLLLLHIHSLRPSFIYLLFIHPLPFLLCPTFLRVSSRESEIIAELLWCGAFQILSIWNMY